MLNHMNKCYLAYSFLKLRTLTFHINLPTKSPTTNFERKLELERVSRDQRKLQLFHKTSADRLTD